MTGNGQGPASPVRATRVTPLRLDAVVLDPDGQLGQWQALNRAATIDHCVDNLESSGVIDNLRRVVGESDADFRGFWFADSDLAKTLEAIGWELGRTGGDRWHDFLTEVTDLLSRVQAEDGYLNSFVQGKSDEPRWDNLRWSHELYVAGHLIQSAIALSRGASDRRLLEVARRLADLLVREFGEGGRPTYDGHPEVETALVELYRETHHEAYLDLAQRQVEQRGLGLLGKDRFGPQYFQDHLPVREATQGTGHAVRQLYLAAGVTDVAIETGDESLLEAMKALWHDIATTKTYVTGAHGSRHRDEAYGDPYELPPDRAYAETCASIAAFQWGWRMLLATGEAQYAEEMERALYNAIAGSTSAGGTEFFYSNPLQLRTGHDGSHEDAPDQRLPWYACACCPPNLARLVASLHAYVATTDAQGVQLQLLTPASITTSAPDGSGVVIEVVGDYPWAGDLEVRVSGGRDPWELAVRIPAWCSNATATIDGQVVQEAIGTDSYLRLTRDWSQGQTVRLALSMAARVIVPHPAIDAVRGCVALARGPVVYCLEQRDQSSVLEELRLCLPIKLEEARNGDGVLVLRAEGMVVRPRADIYQATGDGQPEPAEPGESVTITAVPYHLWANRGPGAMRVWIPTAGAGGAS
jgi:DUF1680 family protein